MSTADQPKGTPAESASDAPQPTSGAVEAGDATDDQADDASDDQAGDASDDQADDASGDQADDASDDQAGDASTADTESSDSATDDSDDCAEIPTYVHARLVAEIKFLLQLPVTTDEASQLPHKFTLTSDDGSVSQTLTLASDSAEGDSAGTSVITFKDLAEHHTYTLQCDNGDATYTVFKDVDYVDLERLQGGGAGRRTCGGR